MGFWVELLKILDTKMEEPALYGWFHLVFFAASIGIGILLCVLHKKGILKNPVKVVAVTAIIVIVLEVYKQINYSFSYGEGVVTFDYQWYSFPWQFCSLPMFVGALAGIIKKGKVHDSLCAFLGTYAVFAGLAIMVYPGDVFSSTVGISIQTMVCHGSMITVGIYLFYSGYVKLEHKTILKAMPVFAIAVGAAVIMNEIAYYSGLLESENFNMFYVSRHCAPHLPVYSEVQKLVPYPLDLIIYILGFTLLAYLILLAAMGIKAAARKVRGGRSVLEIEEKEEATV